VPALLAAGFVVVARDSPGLGVAALSSYLIGTSEARSLLDAVRVARQAGEYAPELSVGAAAVAAPRPTSGRSSTSAASPG
jgi:hypothetical protein